MPSCIVKGCTSSSYKNDPDISLHVFPSQPHKIRKWLIQTGQFEDNLDSMVQNVQYGKVNDVYRICSLHFTIQDYTYTEERRRLKADAFPTVFNQLKINELHSNKEQLSSGKGEANPNPCSTTVTTTTCTVSYAACSNIITTTTSTSNYTSTGSRLTSSAQKLHSLVDPGLLPPPKKIKTLHISKLTGTTGSTTSNTSQSTKTILLPQSLPNQASSSNNLKFGLTKPPPYVFIKKVDKGINTDHFINKKNFVVNTDHHKNKKNVQTQTLIQKKHRTVQCNLAQVIDHEATFSIVEPENWPCEVSSHLEDDGNHRTSLKISRKLDFTEKDIDREDIIYNLFTGEDKIATSTPFNAKKCNSKPDSFLKEHDYTHFSWFDEGSSDCVPQNEQGNPLSPIDQSIFPFSSVPDNNGVAYSVDSSLDPSFFSIEKTGATLTDPSDDSFHISKCKDDPDDSVFTSSEEEIENKNDFVELDTDCWNHAIEEKFVVFECELRKLLKMVKCQSKKNCQGNLVAFKKRYTGSMVSVEVKCSNGHEVKLWNSQPKHKKQPLGNVLISSAVLLSGLSFQKTRLFFDILKLRCIGQSTFFKNQRKYLFPAIDIQWKKEQTAVLEELKNKSLCLIGDGQCDSPGYSAKYCIYTLMDYESKKIVSFSVEQIVPPLTAVSLEKIAFEKNVDYLINSGVDINIIATDRHISIRKIMRENYKSIKHQFDVWHMAKSIGSKVLAASKKKESTILTNWIQLIKNHLWWGSRTCGGDGEQLVTKWKSLLHHVVNVHEWCSPDSYNSCLHPPIVPETNENTKWLFPQSPTFNTLQDIVENKDFIRDIKQLNYFCHTGELETYHSVCLKYRPKRIHFFYDGMLARSQLAALDHNHNVKRTLAVIKKSVSTGDPCGTNRHRLEFSKARKSWVIKALYAPTSQEFMTEIIEEVMRIVREETVPTWRSARLDLPANIASVPKPNKKEMIRQHETRF